MASIEEVKDILQGVANNLEGAIASIQNVIETAQSAQGGAIGALQGSSNPAVEEIHGAIANGISTAQESQLQLMASHELVIAFIASA